METKEYIVCLNRGVDYNQFWEEMENSTNGLSFVPDRRVDIVNNRDVSLRQCHYALTDLEAEILKKDSRIYSVELPHSFTPFKYGRLVGDFTKTTSDTGTFINWGLRRCISPTNVYGVSNTVAGDYTYSLDGTGVDVVIQDSGLQIDHPEFQDANGISRVVAHNWYTVSGVAGTFNAAAHYQDRDGHGTHCAGIAAGKTYGWAKNSAIYAIKVAGLDGGEGGGLSDPDCFDVITGWHNNKSVDPATGVKRPTIVNMSWGYGDFFENINGGNYRGTAWTGATKQTAYGMIGNGFNRHGVRIGYIDVSIQEMIDAGIHVCIAAGNYSQKIDLVGGTDYNNYYVGGRFNGANPNYYHRGSSPHDDEAFIVGSIDSSVHSEALERKSVFSECGPGVNIWAPGSDIMSASSNVNAFGAPSYEFYTPPESVGRNNLGDVAATKVVGSNSYITFNSTTNTISGFSALGASLTVGARDARLISLFSATENGGKSYRLRFEGWSIFSVTTSRLQWEVTFHDNNWIELVVARHDNGTTGADWALRNEMGTDVTSGAFALAFGSASSLAGASATPKSCVFTTTDGISWTFNNDKSVSLVDGVYSLSDSTTTVKGTAGMTTVFNGSADDAVFNYFVPFTFYAFNQSASNPFKQMNISGTSMAAPQVCGVAALFLQMEPSLTPAQLRDKIFKNTRATIYDTGLSDDYTQSRSIQGSSNRMLFNPFSQDQTSQITGSLTLQNIGYQNR
jgi:subtilisin family serine protease